MIRGWNIFHCSLRHPLRALALTLWFIKMKAKNGILHLFLCRDIWSWNEFPFTIAFFAMFRTRLKSRTCMKGSSAKTYVSKERIFTFTTASEASMWLKDYLVITWGPKTEKHTLLLVHGLLGTQPLLWRYRKFAIAFSAWFCMGKTVTTFLTHRFKIIFGINCQALQSSLVQS